MLSKKRGFRGYTHMWRAKLAQKVKNLNFGQNSSFFDTFSGELGLNTMKSTIPAMVYTRPFGFLFDIFKSGAFDNNFKFFQTYQNWQYIFYANLIILHY